MGTIIERKRKDGSVAYMAQIMIMRERKVVHRETKTFDRRAAARVWLEKREADLAKPNAVLGGAAKTRGATLAAAIDSYVNESQRAMGRTKAQVLRSIKEYDIADKPCEVIASPDIVAFARTLAQGRSPATVGNYLSHLAAVFAIARAAWGFPLDAVAMADAQVVCKRLGLSGKSRQRDRRPTLHELERLLVHFSRKDERIQIPMAPISVFALFSTRRQEEIALLRWADLDEGGARVLVRDMKNPGDKIGNNVWCDLPAEALKVALAQPRGGDRIFPYDHRSISAAFTRACKFLAIEDLHFHDLRHDGVSRLFEMGLNIPHVAAVSGHRSWTSLKRYTHLRQTGDKYASWAWVEKVVNPPSVEAHA